MSFYENTKIVYKITYKSAIILRHSLSRTNNESQCKWVSYWSPLFHFNTQSIIPNRYNMTPIPLLEFNNYHITANVDTAFHNTQPHQFFYKRLDSHIKEQGIRSHEFYEYIKRRFLSMIQIQT